MEYNDEQILSLEDYGLIAKAYSKAMRERGYMVVQVDNEKNRALIEDTFSVLSKIKSCLFFLGGFLNTSRFYSLNERQIKKMEIIFDTSLEGNKYSFRQDKTKCLLEFFGHEAHLIKNLITLAEQSSFEQEIYKILGERLSLSQEIFAIN